MKTLVVLAGLLVGCAVSNSTLADPCRSRLPALGAPVRLVLGPGSLGFVPETCPLTEVGVQAFGSALVAVDDFYGYVDGGLSAVLRYAFSDRDWISLRVVPLEYRFFANASIEASRYDTGASAMSYHHTLPLSRIVSIAPYLRVLVPSDTAYQHAAQYGIEHGGSVVALPTTVRHEGAEGKQKCRTDAAVLRKK